MQGCANDFGKLIGKVAVLRMAFGCPDTVPALSEWKRLGAMTTKGIDYSMNTINSEADDARQTLRAFTRPSRTFTARFVRSRT